MREQYTCQGQRIKHKQRIRWSQPETLARLDEQRAIITGPIVRDQRKLTDVGKESAQRLIDRGSILYLFHRDPGEIHDMLWNGDAGSNEGCPRLLRHAIHAALRGNLNDFSSGRLRIRAGRLKIEDDITASPELRGQRDSLRLDIRYCHYIICK